jgi:hypothetical protein
MQKLQAVTIDQPHADGIFEASEASEWLAVKWCENRKYPLPVELIGRPLLIHASSHCCCPEGIKEAVHVHSAIIGFVVPRACVPLYVHQNDERCLRDPNDVWQDVTRFLATFNSADDFLEIDDTCVDSPSDSDVSWYWLLAGGSRFDKPVSCSGHPKLWTPDDVVWPGVQTQLTMLENQYG